MNYQRKVLVTAAGPHMLPLLTTYSLPTFERYANEQGYDIHVERLAHDDLARKSAAAKDARWQKITTLRKLLQSYDLVVWFDADVMIRRYDEDIAKCLGTDDYQGLVLHKVPAENRINPNTGVWVMKQCENSFAFLDTVQSIGMPEGRWADQGAVMRALGWILGDEQYNGARMPDVSNTFLAGTAWLPTGWNQPYVENRPNPEAYVGRPLVAHPYAIHFMAMTIEERMRYMGTI